MRPVTVMLGYIMLVFQGTAQVRFQLAPPRMQYRSIFFSDTAHMLLEFKHPGAAIYYTINGDEPTESNIRYDKPVVIKENKTTITAKAFAPGFLPSDPARVTFIKSGLPIHAVTFTAPHPDYPGSGDNSLSDNLGGIPQYAVRTWSGFKNDTVNIELTLNKIQPVKEIVFSFLQDEDAWIFLPKQITVLAYNNNSKKYILFQQESPFNGKATPGSACALINVITEKNIKTDKLLVQLLTVDTIPEWHSAKGNHAWLFIDEIKVYR